MPRYLHSIPLNRVYLAILFLVTFYHFLFYIFHMNNIKSFEVECSVSMLFRQFKWLRCLFSFIIWTSKKYETKYTQYSIIPTNVCYLPLLDLWLFFFYSFQRWINGKRFAVYENYVSNNFDTLQSTWNMDATAEI